MGQRVNEPLVFPLGLSYLASAIKNAHDVYCFDPNVSENPLDELRAILVSFNPEVVGLSLRNLDSVFSFNIRSYYPMFQLIVRQIKSLKPNCKLVVGEAGFSIFAEEVIEDNPQIDFGILSEGEVSFNLLLSNFEHPERVPNIIYRKEERLGVTQKSMSNFESSNRPSRELFKLRKYSSLYSIGIQSKRGCAYSCVFCSKRVQGGTACRLRPPEMVVDEIEELVNSFGVSSCFFVDSTFNFPLAHCEEICKEIIKRKLTVKWSADFRPDYLNERIMGLCVKAGCSWFSFSPDAASNKAMERLGKNFRVEEIEKTFEYARKTDDAKVGYSFLYDLPFDNRENTSGLVKLVPKMITRCGTKLRYVTFSRIRIYPRTPIFHLAQQQGKINLNANLLYPTYYKSGSLSLDSCLLQVLRNGTRFFTKVNHTAGKQSTA